MAVTWDSRVKLMQQSQQHHHMSSESIPAVHHQRSTNQLHDEVRAHPLSRSLCGEVLPAMLLQCCFLYHRAEPVAPAHQSETAKFKED